VSGLLYKWFPIFNFWGEWRCHSKQSLCDFYSCYINFGRIFAIASNPYVIFIAAILTLVGFYWMWKAWKRRSKGKVMKNVKTTIIFILIFAAGFITASFITHDYFKNIYENKLSVTSKN